MDVTVEDKKVNKEMEEVEVENERHIYIRFIQLYKGKVIFKVCLKLVDC